MCYVVILESGGENQESLQGGFFRGILLNFTFIIIKQNQERNREAETLGWGLFFFFFTLKPIFSFLRYLPQL